MTSPATNGSPSATDGETQDEELQRLIEITRTIQGWLAKRIGQDRDEIAAQAKWYQDSAAVVRKIAAGYAEGVQTNERSLSWMQDWLNRPDQPYADAQRVARWRQRLIEEHLPRGRELAAGLREWAAELEREARVLAAVAAMLAVLAESSEEQ